MQTSAKAAHCPHIAWIPFLESRHSDPDHPINLISFLCIIAELSLKFHINPLIKFRVMAGFPIGQPAW